MGIFIALLGLALGIVSRIAVKLITTTKDAAVELAGDSRNFFDACVADAATSVYYKRGFRNDNKVVTFLRTYLRAAGYAVVRILKKLGIILSVIGVTILVTAIIITAIQ